MNFSISLTSVNSGTMDNMKHKFRNEDLKQFYWRAVVGAQIPRPIQMHAVWSKIVLEKQYRDERYNKFHSIPDYMELLLTVVTWPASGDLLRA